MINKEDFKLLNPKEVFPHLKFESNPYGANYFEVVWASLQAGGLSFLFLDEACLDLGGIKIDFEIGVDLDVLTEISRILDLNLVLTNTLSISDLAEEWGAPVYSFEYETGYRLLEYLLGVEDRFSIVCWISTEGKIAKLSLFHLGILGKEKIN